MNRGSKPPTFGVDAGGNARAFDESRFLWPVPRGQPRLSLQVGGPPSRVRGESGSVVELGSPGKRCAVCSASKHQYRAKIWCAKLDLTPDSMEAISFDNRAT